MIVRKKNKTPCWQVAPVKPEGQLHVNESSPSTQTPPFRQGLLLHSLILIFLQVKGRMGLVQGASFHLSVCTPVILTPMAKQYSLPPLLLGSPGYHGKSANAR